MAALLLAWPFANLGFNDDWTWAFTVLQLGKTGHLLYNGWSSPPVIAQAYWGLLWVKLFGFSFVVLRISSLPMAGGAVMLCYLLARRAGLSAGMSAFAALSLGLSPLFMPLEATFMTDVPGLFFMLLSLFALVAGFESRSRVTFLVWLVTGVIAALVGGSSRQVVWIVPLVVLPYFSWIRRSDVSLVLFSAVGWISLFAGAMAMQHWFGRQPFALPDPPALSYLHTAMAQPRRVALSVVCVILTLAMMMLPAMIGCLRQKPGVRELLAAVLFVVTWLLLRHHLRAAEPWMGNIFSNTGVLSSIEVGSGRPPLLGERGRVLLSVVVITAIWLLLSSAGAWVWQNRRGLAEDFRCPLFKPAQQQAVVVAMVLLAMALFVLEITRCISNVAYDRHLLPMIPFLVIPLLCALARGGLTRLPMECWILLGIFGIFAMASTQEVNSLARARVTAIQRLENGGILPTQIDGGFEHDYWTQLESQGHINDARLRNPPGAYDRTKGPTPAMRVLYRLESTPTSVTTPTVFGSVKYFSLLPPFHRTVYIDRFTEPWWLDPRRTATRPVDTKQALPKVLIEQYRDR